MGRYIDWSDISARYSDFPADISAEQSEPMITDAEGEVEARLAPRYAVPFAVGTNAPPMVRTLSADLVYYRRIWASERGDKLKEYIDQRFNALLAGSMSLTTSGGLLEDAGVVAWQDKPYRSSFGPDDPVHWRPSVQAAEDAQDERLYD